MLAPQQPVTIDTLEGAPLPKAPPWASATSQWRPVRHADLARAVLRGARERGLVEASQSWQLLRGGHDLIGAIAFDADGRWPAEVRPAIALRHSNVGRYAVTLALGAEVFVCSNGLLVGEVVVKHRHTTGIDLAALVAEGLDEFVSSGARTEAFIDRLRGIPVSAAQQAETLLRAARTGVIPWRLAKHVDQAWQDGDVHGGRTAWRLYNAFTLAIKERSPAGQLASLRGLTTLFGQETST